MRPLAALRNLALATLPYTLERFVSPALLARLLALVLAEPVDVVQFEGTFVAWYAGQLHEALNARGLRAGQQPRFVLRTHNVEYTIWEMLAVRATNPLKKWYLQKLAHRLQAFEKQMLHRVDAVAAITEEDATRLRGMYYAGLPAPRARRRPGRLPPARCPQRLPWCRLVSTWATCAPTPPGSPSRARCLCWARSTGCPT